MFERWNEPIRSPYLFLILGYISISAAAFWTYKGKVWVRFYGGVYRAEEPKSFWWEVAIYYLVGIAFIGISFYLVS